ncbi:hybrid sensor histidine kinase/response regulator [Rubellimicrobium arenae]|uniref:hybrid sensor histidine kinase/response regulator n=1 Tax=Rubellimicrobium arenae TaxID=2817372 RepID=UPI001B305433|nr:PAS domain-containing sensor histidine kinase [Rubellimicrobium arenae]
MDRILPEVLGWDEGPVARMVRSHDWAATPLGLPRGWPQPLRTLLGVMMGASQPMFVAWGAERTLIYNEAYARILADRHPAALGGSFLEVWHEIRHDLAPIVDRVFRGEPVQMDDITLHMERWGCPEEAHFAFSYTPVRDEEGAVAGFFCACQEITGQVMAERRIRDSEAQARADAERVRLALEAGAIVGTWSWDVAADVFRADERFARSFGLDPEACRRGLGIAEVVQGVHPEDLPGLDAAMDAALARGGPYRHQYRVRQQDGTFRWIEANGRVDLGPDGRPLRFPGVLLDVEERRAVEAERDRARRLLEVFAEAVPGVVYAKDLNGRMLVANRGTTELIGKPPQDYLGRTDAEFLEDKAQAQAVMANDRRIMESGQAEQIEEEVQRPDGTPAWWLSTKAPLRDAGGEVVGLIGSSVDITARKEAEIALGESEERFRNMADHAPVMMWVTDPHGFCTYLNRAWYDFTGQTEAEALGLGWLEATHPDDKAEAERVFLEANATRSTFRIEYRLRRADGAGRWAIDAAAPRFGPGGEFLGYIGSVIDITERKEAEAALQEVNAILERRVAEAIAEREQAEEALRQSQKMEAVGQLTGGIAHDFNNMLAAVVGSLDLLGRRIGADDARSRRYVDAAMEGARRAATLTQRLLAFSRQQPLRPETLDANRLVQGMSDLLRGSLGAGVRLETVLAGGLWTANADPNQLENVILNLAVNARDAMPDGGRLTIETANAHLDSHYVAAHLGIPSGQYVLIAVSDTGTGMPPEVIARAFDPFFTTKPVGQGTGLGLSQVYGFVRQSGGHVKIYSEVGQGTCVKIYLPRMTSAEAPDNAAEAPVELPRGEAEETVLVVEDEPMVRQFTVDALAELGYRVLEADGAAVALRLLDAHPEVTLLFTDIVMPDTNGRKLADEALRRRPGLKVLFTTGYTRNAVVHNGVLDPGVHLLGKPFTLEELAAKMREVLDGLAL